MKFRKEKNVNVAQTGESGYSEAEPGISAKYENVKKLTPFRMAIIILSVIIVLLAAKRILFSKEKIEIDPLSTVSVAYAEKEDVSVDTSLIGTVMPADVYYVTPKVSGEITEIFVSVGDTVNEGDLICKIDNSKAVDAAGIQVDQAKVQLQTSSDAVSVAKANLDRMSALLKTGDISEQSYEQTKNAYDQAAAAYEAAKLQKEGAELQYNTQAEYSEVTAPAAGTVESTDMSINGLASAGSQVCVISSEGENKIRFNVTDRLLASFEPGTPISVRKQGSVYAANVTSVSTLPDSGTGLYKIEAAFSKHSDIPNGSSVKLEFTEEEHKGVLAVDTDIIAYEGGKTYVYTLSYNDEKAKTAEESTIAEGNRAGTVHKTEVETGLSNSDVTEIISGIDENSLLITTWTSQLFDGAQVQVLSEE